MVITFCPPPQALGITEPSRTCLQLPDSVIDSTTSYTCGKSNGRIPLEKKLDSLLTSGRWYFSTGSHTHIHTHGAPGMTDTGRACEEEKPQGSLSPGTTYSKAEGPGPRLHLTPDSPGRSCTPVFSVQSMSVSKGMWTESTLKTCLCRDGSESQQPPEDVKSWGYCSSSSLGAPLWGTHP